MFKFAKTTIALAAAGLLVAGLAACSSTPTVTHSATPTKSSASATPKPVAVIPTLTGVDTAVALDSNFVAALKTLNLTPGTVGTATLVNGSLHFPITGGNVTYYNPKEKYRPYVQGIIDHEGSGFSLTSGSTTVQLTNFVINPGTSTLTGDVTVNGTVAAKGVLLFNLYGGTLKPLEISGNDAILTGTTVHLSAPAAALLDKTFNTTAVKSQLLIGVATITVIAK